MLNRAVIGERARGTVPLARSGSRGRATGSVPLAQAIRGRAQGQSPWLTLAQKMPENVVNVD